MLNSQHNFVLYAFKNILEHAYLLCIMVKSLLSFACRIFDLSQMFTVHRTISTDKKYIKEIILPASHTQTRLHNTLMENGRAVVILKPERI